jgi:hypothetical protein
MIQLNTSPLVEAAQAPGFGQGLMGGFNQAMTLADMLDTRKSRQMQRAVEQQSIDVKNAGLEKQKLIGSLLSQPGARDEQGNPTSEAILAIEKFDPAAGQALREKTIELKDKQAETLVRNATAAEKHIEFMKKGNDNILGIADSAAETTDPVHKAQYYGLLRKQYLATAQDYERSPDVLPDTQDPKEIDAAITSLKPYLQGHAAHAEEQVKANSAEMKEQKDKLTFNKQFDPGAASARSGIGAANRRIMDSTAAISTIKNVNVLTADDFNNLKQLVFGMSFGTGAPSTLYGKAQSLVTTLSGKVGSQITQSEKQQAVSILSNLRSEARKTMSREWTSAGENFPQYSDMVKNWEASYPTYSEETVSAGTRQPAGQPAGKKSASTAGEIHLTGSDAKRLAELRAKKAAGKIK